MNEMLVPRLPNSPIRPVPLPGITRGSDGVGKDREEAPVLKPMFGEVACTHVYRRAKERVIERQILRLYQRCELREGFVSIIICNLWRIDRSLTTPEVETFDWHLAEARWVPTQGDCRHWPFIDLLPIRGDQARHQWKAVLQHALTMVLYDAGLKTLPRKGGTRQRLWERFTGHYLRAKTSRSHFRLDAKRLSAAMRALRKNLWTTVIDREVLTLASSMVGYRQTLRLHDYLRCAEHWPALRRVAEEHRNLVPLMEDILPKHWGRPDLFSRRLWVKGTRKTTVVDRPGFMRQDGWRQHYLSSFDSRGDVRWLLRAPVSVVGHLKETIRRSPRRCGDMVRTLRMAMPRDPVPALTIRVAMNNLHNLSPDDAAGVRLLRAWLLDCRRIWQEEGYRHLCQVMHSPGMGRELSLALDWFRREGRGAGLPDKHMDWTAIKRHSDIWHERIALAVCPDEVPQLTWSSPLPDPIERDGYRITPLTSTEALYREGRRMHHCVGSYHRDCHAGGYLVFAIVGDCNVDRATLGLKLTAGGRWHVDQVYGPCNAPASSAIESLSQLIAREVTRLACDPTHSTGGTL